jgi:hypothetical protein
MTPVADANESITIARLLALTPESVYRELHDYGESISKHELGAHANEELEKALLGRADRLINLGLAQFGGSPSVVRLLYSQAKDGTGDPIQDRAVRFAFLSNQVWPHRIFGRDQVLDEAEIRRLASEGEGKEVWLLLRNPSQRRLVDKLFNQEPPFNDLPNDRLRALVAYASGNPALSHDDSNRFGPDLEAWGIQKGVYKLLKTAPVEKEWANVLFWLLYNLDRERAPYPDSNPMIVLNRWRALPIEKTKDDDIYGFPKGHWTHSLETGQEFLCYMAAVFGAWSEPGVKPMKINYLGSFDDPDQLMRCAYYGHAKLTPKQMELAAQRDGDAFMLAALCNDRMYSTEARAKLEELMRGDVRRFYYRRCKQKNARHKDFDPRPVSQAGIELLDDIIETPSEEQQKLTALEARLTGVQRQLDKMQKYAGWTIAILALTALAVIFRR